MSLDISSFIPKASTTASAKTDLAANPNSTESFETHLQQQLNQAKQFTTGYGLSNIIGDENPSPINPLSELTNPSLAGALEPSQNDQIAELMKNAGASISNRLQAFGQEMTGMMEELMASLKSGEIQKWAPEKAQDAIRRLRGFDKHLGRTIQGVEGRKDIPHNLQFQQDLSQESAQATEYFSISVAALTQFSIQGHCSAEEGLKEAYDSVGDKVLEKNEEVRFQFEMSFSMIFSITSTQQQTIVAPVNTTVFDPENESISKLQEDLLSFLKSKDTAASNAFLDKIYAMMKASETDTAESVESVEEESEAEILA